MSCRRTPQSRPRHPTRAHSKSSAAGDRPGNDPPPRSAGRRVTAPGPRRGSPVRSRIRPTPSDPEQAKRVAAGRTCGRPVPVTKKGPEDWRVSPGPAQGPPQNPAHRKFRIRPAESVLESIKLKLNIVFNKRIRKIQNLSIGGNVTRKDPVPAATPFGVVEEFLAVGAWHGGQGKLSDHLVCRYPTGPYGKAPRSPSRTKITTGNLDCPSRSRSFPYCLSRRI